MNYESLDPIDIVLIDRYVEYSKGYYKGRSEPMLGFDLSSRVFDVASMLGEECVVENVYKSSRVVPSMMLYECTNGYMTRQKRLVQSGMFITILLGESYYNIYPSFNYNKSTIFITSISCDSSIIYDVSYISIVLLVYKRLTSTSLGSRYHVEESTNFIRSISTDKYVPITHTYVSALSEITRSSSSESVNINPKYDGTPYWMYISSTVPLSLLSQTKSKSGVVCKYIGRVSSNLYSNMKDSYAILLEKIQIGDVVKYVLIDCFSSSSESSNFDYNYRISQCLKISKDYMSRDNTATLELLTNYTQVVRYSVDVLQSNVHDKNTSQSSIHTGDVSQSDVHNISSIHSMHSGHTKHCVHPMHRVYAGHSGHTAHTVNFVEAVTNSISVSSTLPVDGWILYIGNKRPIKVKLRDSTTVDVLLKKSQHDSYEWDTQVEYIRGIQPPQLQYYDLDSVVIEVNLYTGQCVRIRRDREKGNPDAIIQKILDGFKKDIRYSTPEVWKGDSSKLAVLLNREFKNYIISNNIREGSKIVDFGSGNGSDVNIWMDMGLSVLCIEHDASRVDILKTKIAKHKNIVVVCCDMRNSVPVLDSMITKYKVATFMRSLSHLTMKEIHRLLTSLISKKINRILIVTLVRDNVPESYRVDYPTGEYFSISHTSTNCVTTEYLADSKIISYQDYCYSVEEWRKLFDSMNCTYAIHYQSSFMQKVYNITKNSKLVPCFTDAAFVLY